MPNLFAVSHLPHLSAISQGIHDEYFIYYLARSVLELIPIACTKESKHKIRKQCWKTAIEFSSIWSSVFNSKWFLYDPCCSELNTLILTYLKVKVGAACSTPCINFTKKALGWWWGCSPCDSNSPPTLFHRWTLWGPQCHQRHSLVHPPPPNPTPPQIHHQTHAHTKHFSRPHSSSSLPAPQIAFDDLWESTQTCWCVS